MNHTFEEVRFLFGHATEEEKKIISLEDLIKNKKEEEHNRTNKQTNIHTKRKNHHSSFVLYIL